MVRYLGPMIFCIFWYLVPSPVVTELPSLPCRSAILHQAALHCVDPLLCPPKLFHPFQVMGLHSSPLALPGVETCLLLTLRTNLLMKGGEEEKPK